MNLYTAPEATPSPFRIPWHAVEITGPDGAYLGGFFVPITEAYRRALSPNVVLIVG